MFKSFKRLSLAGVFLAGIMAVSVLHSCSPKFDKIGSENAANLGSKLPELMGKATEAYAKHSDAVSAMQADLQKAYDHAASIKGNSNLANAWKVLKDELAGPFFARWKENAKIDKDVVKESVKQVNASLDSIKKAEMAKKKK